MATKESLKLAALQIKPAKVLKDTFHQIQTLLDQAFSELDPLDCIVLPEYCFGTFREWSIMNQGISDSIQTIHNGISDLAQQNDVAVVAGSVPFQTEDKQWRNRCFIFSSAGKLLGFYDKQHPFRTEKLLGLEPGIQTPIFKMGNLRMAVRICSDLWYHEKVSELTNKIDFLAVPTMTTVLNSQHIDYGQWAWQSLVAVRSKEYTLPIISTDQASREYTPGVFTCGSSCIADPSFRFSNDEGPSTQTLRTALSQKTHCVTSEISLKAVKEYSQYRRDVGLRK